MFKRIAEFLLTIGRQVIPISGVVGFGWHPIAALAVYWFESVLLALVAAALCALMERQLRPALAGGAFNPANPHAPEAVARAQAFSRANLRASDVLLFHGGSLVFFGVFFGLLMVIFVGNGHVAGNLDFSAISDGLIAMAVVVAIGFTIDLWNLDRMPITALESRVTACASRWALFWILGFVGTWLIGLTGKAMLFFSLFTGLKVTWEIVARVRQVG